MLFVYFLLRQPHSGFLIASILTPQSTSTTKSKSVSKMSYNPRMSIVPTSQQQNRGKKKEDDSDAFMRLVQIHIPSVAIMKTNVSKAR